MPRIRPLQPTPPPSRRLIRRRLRITALVVTALFLAAIGRLTDVQVLSPDRYVAQGREQRLVSKVIPAGRGSIVDRHGTKLALSIPQSSIFADPALVDDPVATAATLAPLLDRDPGELASELTGDGRYVLLAHTVADPVARQVSEADLDGIGAFEEFKRYRPAEALAQSLVGDVSVDGAVGISGLEAQFDSALSGDAGEITYERSKEGATIVGGHQQVTPAQPGGNLRLTLDRALQYQAEQVLAGRIGAVGAKGGMAIVSRTETGEVLAMANMETDPETGLISPSANNEAVTTVFEPGSVNKMITVAGALEEGVTEPDTVRTVPDSVMVGDHEFTDHDPHPTTDWTTTDILATSSNVGTIGLARDLGAERVDEYLRRFGFGTRTGIGFPNESPGLMLDLDEWSGTSIGAIPLGQGISVTALQMLTAYNAIANDGVLVPPRLIDAVGPPGDAEPRDPAPRRRVTSVGTAAEVRSMLAQVVADGTGTDAQVPGYPVAGKTGTARKPVAEHVAGDGYRDLAGNYHYVASFVGFVPAGDPELSIIVVLDEPTSSIYASDTSAPTFAELARYALRRYDIPPSAVADAGARLPELSDSARDIAEERVPASPGESPPVTGASQGA